jgi:glycosyltransferase involved in cell wall biosynthesis
MYLAAVLLEAAYRLLARVCPVIVVGPDLARRYRHSPRVEQIAISLIRESQITSAAEANGRSYDGELTVLSVGRLEQEKNPLLLAEILARLGRLDRRWRLLVYGEGPLEAALEARLEELGVLEHAELRGYVPLDGGLLDVYKESHAFLHVSWTEGLPQVVFEAFATGLPLVATAVGGVPAAVGEAALLVPPDDAEAAAGSLSRIAAEPGLRRSMIESGLQLARQHTIESECRRVTDVLEHSSIFSLGRHKAG